MSTDLADETCTAWLYRPSDACGRPAVTRRGLRCRSGCLGEGVFDYACRDHTDNLADDRDRNGCMKCRNESLEWFPIQDLHGRNLALTPSCPPYRKDEAR